jgi:hypothetical protein
LSAEVEAVRLVRQRRRNELATLVVRGRKHDYQGTEHAVSTTRRGTSTDLRARCLVLESSRLTIDAQLGQFGFDGLIGRKQITLEHLRSISPAFQ